MGFWGNLAADLFQVQLHGFGVGIGQHDGCASASCRADSAEQVGILVALIGGLAGACAFAGPDARAAVLLAYARLILPPDFHAPFPAPAGQMGFEGLAEVF